MSTPIVSVVVSSVRPQLWNTLCISISSSTSLPCEVILVGNRAPTSPLPEWRNPKPPRRNQQQRGVSRSPGGARFIYSDETPCKCWNIGFREARGKYVIYGMDDLIFLPNSIDAMIEECESRPNPRKTIIAPRYRELIRDAGWEDFVGYTAKVNPHVPEYFSDNIKIAPLFLLYRSFLEELGGFREFYWNGICENDLCVRAFCKGGEVVVGSEATMVLFIHTAHGHEESHTPYEIQRRVDSKLFYEVWKDGYEAGMERTLEWGERKRLELSRAIHSRLEQLESLQSLRRAIKQTLEVNLLNQRVVLYGISTLAELVMLELFRRSDISVVGFADGMPEKHYQKFLDRYTIQPISEIPLDEYDAVLICARSEEIEHQIYQEIKHLKECGKRIVGLLSHEYY